MFVRLTAERGVTDGHAPLAAGCTAGSDVVVTALERGAEERFPATAVDLCRDLVGFAADYREHLHLYLWCGASGSPSETVHCSSRRCPL